MSFYHYNLEEVTEFDERLADLSALISSVDRPGEYCMQGHVSVPMPRLEVEGVGMLSFPIPPSQADQLVACAESAPYGRGQETIVDRSVRNCWQIAAGAVSLGGRTWPETFASILAQAAVGLGYPEGAVSAELYKLLVYEPGGFFVPHRDTEKVDNMVATLVVSLPVSGAGGDLVVRHKSRKTVIDMRVEEPSDLAFAAFFADCEHEVRLVEAGHRICLVFNLVKRAGQEVAETAPEFEEKVAGIAGELRRLGRAPEGMGKVIWVLEHDYSEAGLSFDALKNVDATVARVLLAAAAQADCILQAATISICEEASVEHFGRWRVDEIEDVDESEYEVIETIEVTCALENLTGPDGTTSETKVPLHEGELMPKGCLDDEEPDRHRLTEATGNAGATVERIYRRAALVLWHRGESLRVLEDSGTEPMICFLADEYRRESEGGRPSAPLMLLASQCAEGWPLRKVSSGSWERNSERLLDILFRIDALDAAKQFVSEKLLPSYPTVRSSETATINTVVIRATGGIGIELMRDHLVSLVRTSVLSSLDALVELAGALRGRMKEEGERRVIQEMVFAMCEGLASFPVRERNEHTGIRRFYFAEMDHDPVKVETLHRLCTLVWDLGHGDAGELLATTLVGRPDLVRPCHEVTDLLASLYRDRQECARQTGFATVWHHCAEALLARSATLPEPPADWSVSIDGLNCTCPHCADLRAFCVDPVAQVGRFSVRRDLRQHLRRQIQSARTDIEYETERRGSPHKLVCTKTRRSHELRQAEYIGDLDRMRQLMISADTVQASDDIVRGLRAALQAGSGRIDDPDARRGA